MAQSKDVTAILGETALLKCRIGGVGNRQSGDLSLVQSYPDTVLLLVEITVLLRQHFYAIKTQLKTPNISTLSLCLYGIRVAPMQGRDLNK